MPFLHTEDDSHSFDFIVQNEFSTLDLVVLPHDLTNDLCLHLEIFGGVLSSVVQQILHKRVDLALFEVQLLNNVL